MKAVLLSGLAVLLILLLVSCGNNEAVTSQTVRQAYRQGADDAIRELQKQAQQTKQQLMGQLQPKLLIGAVIVLLVTFFGDFIAERIREILTLLLRITPRRQAILLGCGYLLICFALAAWSLYRCGIIWSLPVIILLTGATALFFIGYLPSLFQPVKETRRLALSKIKLLLFAVCVILAIHELLAADGWLKLPV